MFKNKQVYQKARGKNGFFGFGGIILGKWVWGQRFEVFQNPEKGSTLSGL
jgi:hypothetical protein